MRFHWCFLSEVSEADFIQVYLLFHIVAWQQETQFDTVLHTDPTMQITVTVTLWRNIDIAGNALTRFLQGWMRRWHHSQVCVEKSNPAANRVCSRTGENSCMTNQPVSIFWSLLFGMLYQRTPLWNHNLSHLLLSKQTACNMLINYLKSIRSSVFLLFSATRLTISFQCLCYAKLTGCII